MPTDDRNAAAGEAMLDWNVVVTAGRNGYEDAEAALRSLGRVERTRFFNVLVMRVDDTGTFLEKLATMGRVNPDLLERCISRVVPADETFDFQSRDGFRREAARIVRARSDELASKSFHVRMERRGLEGVLDSQEEERFLGDEALDALVEGGSSAEVTFEDPDVVVAVETVSVRAGVALLGRDDRERFSFLRAG